MLHSGHIAAVAASREALLGEIGAAPDLTFVRGIGNVGDELIYAGTRELLSGHVYREIALEDLPAAGGDTALLSGGGGWCGPYHDWMPEALAIAEMRFDRVIVLPSSFDVTVDRVRDALRRTGATVFAREAESYQRIAGLCRARLAHDCAFFLDLSGYETAGSGVLNAFRTDLERADPGAPLPADNEDLSFTAASLEEWLATIARYERVRTDRAHVLIAAALMGKPIEYAPGSYFKVDALADTWLEGFPLTRIEPAPRSSPPRPRRPADPRVTVVEPSAAADARVRRTGRQLAAEVAGTEFVLLLDDGAALEPGALEHLVADLAAHPEAVGVTPLVRGTDGAVRHFGGWVEISGGQAAFGLDRGETPTGPSGWLPGGAALVRTDALREDPLDDGLEHYVAEDWCLRVEQRRPGSFRRCREAVAVHDPPEGNSHPALFIQRAEAVRRLAAQAAFYRRHGLLVEPLAEDPAAARLLLELVHARGPEWTMMEWINGGLAPLLGPPREEEDRRLLEWLHERNATLMRVEEGGWWRLRSRLMPVLRAAERVRGR